MKRIAMALIIVLAAGCAQSQTYSKDSAIEGSFKDRCVARGGLPFMGITDGAGLENRVWICLSPEALR